MMALSKIIGISGVTNGGKTTLCQMLLRHLQNKKCNVTHINMDTYYWEEDDPHHVQLEEFNYQHSNWDDVCAVNWGLLIDDVARWKKQAAANTNSKSILLVEGIMIFNNRDLLKYFDHKYFVTLPKEECWKRRQTRAYNPPDPDGYFDKIVWPYYLKFLDEISNHSDIAFLDGVKPVDSLFNKLLSDVGNFCQT